MHVTLSMTCNMDHLKEINFYAWGQFAELSTATESDGA